MVSHLSGSARSVLTEMRAEDRGNWDLLVQKIEQTFGGVGMETAYQAALRTCVRRPGQTPREWQREVRRMANKAYPKMGEEAREELVKSGFIQGLSDGQMRLQTVLRKPKTTEEALAFVITYESASLPVGKRVAAVTEGREESTVTGRDRTLLRKPREIGAALERDYEDELQQIIAGLQGNASEERQYRGKGCDAFRADSGQQGRTSSAQQSSGCQHTASQALTSAVEAMRLQLQQLGDLIKKQQPNLEGEKQEKDPPGKPSNRNPTMKPFVRGNPEN